MKHLGVLINDPLEESACENVFDAILRVNETHSKCNTHNGKYQYGKSVSVSFEYLTMGWAYQNIVCIWSIYRHHHFRTRADAAKATGAPP